jgi:aldehyde:ferredoxin oxidoreductase
MCPSYPPRQADEKGNPPSFIIKKAYSNPIKDGENFLKGWNGRILRVNLSTNEIAVWEYPRELAEDFLGGRGFAVKLLWDELEPGTDSLSPNNLLILATGPLTGFPLPNSGKLVIASKSPLTGGYGDGNIGTLASTNLRKSGLDAVVVTGRAEKPCYLRVEDDEIEVMDASEIWGLDSFEAEKNLKDEHGRSSGVVLIGPAGENLARISTVVSQGGRAGGRPGMGAVMGSKNLKALVFKGTKDLEAHDPEALRKLGAEGYQTILKLEDYEWWKRQGTMATIEWGNEHNTLPTNNFKEGTFDETPNIDGYAMEKLKTGIKGCPNCNMTCGNTINDSEGIESELDYENVAMLGANIGLGDLEKVATLNRYCDQMGLDTIGAGNVLAFAMEASEKNLLDLDIGWGDFEGSMKLLEDISHMRGLGATLGLGVKAAAENIGKGAADFAVHVKGLECSAYDCHVCPGMALSFGTSPIGAHHKDAWVISWEISTGRRAEYDPDKADKVIEFQRIRGGMFESLVACRFPWIEIGFDLENYPKYFEAATGVKKSLEDMYLVGDRIYALMRAFWIREFNGEWSRQMDHPPKKWFDEPLQEGALKGGRLDREKYDQLLQAYYDKRGWDHRGVPTTKTMRSLGLEKEAAMLGKYIKLK